MYKKGSEVRNQTYSLGLLSANYALHAVHITVILISTFGWLWLQTLYLTVAVQISVAGAWLLVGPLMGKGLAYCPATELQWHIRRKLGLSVPDWGYVKFLSDALIGHDIDAELIDRIIAWVFGVSVICSITVLVATSASN
jgi:hypothetical protein